MFKNSSKPLLFVSHHIRSFESSSPSSAPSRVFAVVASASVGVVRRDGPSAPSAGVEVDRLTVPPSVQGRVHVLPSTVGGKN